MTDRKILFRGFHPDDNGTTTIIIDGKKVTGEFAYVYIFSTPPFRRPIRPHAVWRYEDIITQYNGGE